MVWILIQYGTNLPASLGIAGPPPWLLIVYGTDSAVTTNPTERHSTQFIINFGGMMGR